MVEELALAQAERGKVLVLEVVVRVQTVLTLLVALQEVMVELD
jgi:hypothetical protein